jgi:hypothetical protein
MSGRSASYGPLLAGYAAATGTLAYVARRHARIPVPRPEPTDVLLLGLGTFKLSRLVTKEKVLQPMREPFVEDAQPGEGAEVNSKPGGAGIRRAIGELLTCPFCISVWIATILVAAFAIAPRGARLVTAGLSAVAVADAAQYAYTSLHGKAS